MNPPPAPARIPNLPTLKRSESQLRRRHQRELTLITAIVRRAPLGRALRHDATAPSYRDGDPGEDLRGIRRGGNRLRCGSQPRPQPGMTRSMLPI